MHLIELIAELEAVKVARGNVKLVDVIVVASGDPKPIADYADRSAARSAPPVLAIDVTGMSDDQVEEILAENPTAKLLRRAVDHSDKPSELCHTPGCRAGQVGHPGECIIVQPVIEDEGLDDQCGAITDGQPCMLPAGHGGDCATGAKPAEDDGAEVVETKPPVDETKAPEGETKPAIADLAKVMEDAAAKLPEGERADEMPVRCKNWDGHGNQCTLSLGHDTDHMFLKYAEVEAASEAAKPTESSPGDAGLPGTLQE